MNRTIILLACLTLSGPAAQAQSIDTRAVATRIRESTCQNCHGPTGNSSDPTVPRLNGQQASYIYARLHSFRYPIRESPRTIHSMGDIAPNLTSQIIAALANYYSEQPSSQVALKDRSGTEGWRIYTRGIGRDTPACQNCHGKEGQGGAQAPRLAGQHSEYLALQLGAFATAARIGDPMNHHVWLMTPEQMKAVASYLGQ